MTENDRIQAIINNGGCHLKTFKSNNITYDMCLTAVKDTGAALPFVPEEYRTEDICKIACKTYALALRDVPDKWKTKTICETAVETDGAAIDYVPKSLLTREMYLKAACSNPSVMKIIPIEFITPEFCIEACKQHGVDAIRSIPLPLKYENFFIQIVDEQPETIWHIPKSNHTVAVCKAAIASSGFNSTAEAVTSNPSFLSQLHTSLYDHDSCLAFVKSPLFATANNNETSGFNSETDFKNGMLYLELKYNCRYSLKHILCWQDVCEIALKILPSAIEFVKKSLISNDLCKLALENDTNGFVFRNIPEEFRTRELSLLAFKKNPYNIEYIPEKHLDSELCLEAVKYSGYILQSLPEHFKSKEVCLAAIKSRANELEHVPTEVLDEEICLAAFNNRNDVFFGFLKKVPEQFRTYAVCLSAVKSGTDNMKYVPEIHKTYELCFAAAMHDAVLQYVPTNYFTEELCLASVSNGTGDFNLIPKSCLTEKICLEALNHSDRYAGMIISQIPRELLTQEMCNIAVKRSAGALKAIPEEYVTEEILMQVADTSPCTLSHNFPKRFRTLEFAKKILSKSPNARYCLMSIIQDKIPQESQLELSLPENTMNYDRVPSIQHTSGKVIHFIQQALFEGKKPNENDVYIFKKKELFNGSGISASSFEKYIEVIVRYLQTGFDLKKWAKYEEYEGEQLFINVAYERGCLSFQRNPLTLSPELDHLWALPPLYSWFAYDYFDENHRRRTNGPAIFDAIPW